MFPTHTSLSPGLGMLCRDGPSLWLAQPCCEELWWVTGGRCGPLRPSKRGTARGCDFSVWRRGLAERCRKATGGQTDTSLTWHSS